MCDEAVTNPICTDCLKEQMKTWLGETEPGLIAEVEEITKWFNYLEPISRCALCGREMKVCRHCFTKEIFTVIQHQHPELEETFLQQFNYELTGY